GKSRPSRLKRPQATEAEEHPKRESHPAARQQRRRADRVPEARDPGLIAPLLADQAVEQIDAGDDRDRADQVNAEKRSQGRKQNALGEEVVPSVPARVPDLKTV